MRSNGGGESRKKPAADASCVYEMQPTKDLSKVLEVVRRGGCSTMMQDAAAEEASRKKSEMQKQGQRKLADRKEIVVLTRRFHGRVIAGKKDEARGEPPGLGETLYYCVKFLQEHYLGSEYIKAAWMMCTEEGSVARAWAEDQEGEPSLEEWILALNAEYEHHGVNFLEKAWAEVKVVLDVISHLQVA